MISPPFSKSGKSSIVPGIPPYYYGSTFLACHVRIDKDKISDLVPKFLDAGDEAIFSIREFVTGTGENWHMFYEEPSLTHYMEAAVGIKVKYGGKDHLYYPYMWVDHDFALMRGFLSGYPKKIANIDYTRFHKLLPKYKKPGRGTILSGYVSRYSGMIFRITMTLEKRIERPVSFGPLLTLKMKEERENYSFDLFRLEMQDFVYDDVWSGKFTLEIGDPRNEEIDKFVISENLSGYYYSVGFRTKDLVFLQNYTYDETF